MRNFIRRSVILLLGFGAAVSALGQPNGTLNSNSNDSFISHGRSADSTTKVISEIREAERRRIPLDVALKASPEYSSGDPVEVTVMVTNLFDVPLLMNRRMLVNHPRLEGELAFAIIGPDGKRCEFKSLVTPMSISPGDFIVLPRGESIQRSVNLAELYRLPYKGHYKAVVYYHNDLDQPMGNMRAWKGVVASEPTDFVLN